MDRSKSIINLSLGYSGAIAGFFIVVLISRNFLIIVPLLLRMPLMIAVYWIPALASLYLIMRDNISSYDLGFRKGHELRQIITGIITGIILSLFLTLIPHILGYGDYADNGRRYRYFWQYLFEFIYCISAVGAVEELIFRGYIYSLLKKISKSQLMPVLLSSLLFGFSHFMNGNMMQVVMTFILGCIFCLMRLKIKNCTTLSLIICHGVYDAMISVWASLLLK